MAGIDETVLVLGRHAELMQKALQDAPPLLSRTQSHAPMPLHVVLNPEPEAGQNSSLQLGLSAAKNLNPPPWLMVALADQPLIEADDLKDLMAAVKHAPTGTQMLQPTVNGQPGNPVTCFLPSSCRPFCKRRIRAAKSGGNSILSNVLAWPSTNPHSTALTWTPLKTSQSLRKNMALI
jgi:CTP:molybdopterin cytidylyltransferase MocA